MANGKQAKAGRATCSLAPFIVPSVGRMVDHNPLFRHVLDNPAVVPSLLLEPGVLGRWGFLFVNVDTAYKHSTMADSRSLHIVRKSLLVMYGYSKKLFFNGIPTPKGRLC